MDVAPHGTGVSPDVNRPASVVSDRYGCMGRSLHQLRELIVDTRQTALGVLDWRPEWDCRSGRGRERGPDLTRRAASLATRRCASPTPPNERCNSIVMPFVRSDGLQIAELPTPRRRSHSRCPGTASAALAGRSRIMISGEPRLPRLRTRALGVNRPFNCGLLSNLHF